MDWQNDEFETLLRKFRLREARPLTLVQPVGIRRYRVKIAAVAALVLALGASAAIVRQRSMKNDVPALVETTVETIQEAPRPLATETPVGVATAAASTMPPAPQPKSSSIKPDPDVPEPLVQLTVAVPAAPQDAGPLSKQDSPQQAEAVRAAAGAEEAQGQKIFTAACGSCHVPDLIGNSHFDTPEEYAAIVNRMVGIGAPVSPQEAAAVVHYLFQTYGKKQSSGTEDGAKTVFNMACGVCHATDLVEGRKDADMAAYRAIVNNMILYGAAVAPEQIDPLVEYLFKTYGRRLK